MNLQFISWDDLNAIKENLDQYVSKFAQPSNAWIEEELGHSPISQHKVSNAGYSPGYVSTDGQGLFNRCG